MTIGTTKSYTTTIKVKDIRETSKIIWIKDEEDKVYSYFKNDGELEQAFQKKIKKGNELSVFIKVKEQADGKTFLNLYVDPFAKSNKH